MGRKRVFAGGLIAGSADAGSGRRYFYGGAALSGDKGEHGGRLGKESPRG